MIDDRAVRHKEAANILGISVAMIWKLLSDDPQFPRGSKLGKARVWLLSDLYEYIKTKKDKKEKTNAK